MDDWMSVCNSRCDWVCTYCEGMWNHMHKELTADRHWLWEQHDSRGTPREWQKGGPQLNFK